MRDLVLLSALVALTSAVPQDPEWHFGPHSHPGWSRPSVYTPPESWRPMTFYSRGGFHSSFRPTPTPSTPITSGSVSSTSTSSTGAPSPSNGTSVDACASVAQLQASFTSASPSATATVPAELAFECITSVPFNGSAAVELMNSIRPYLNWQTTLNYMKDPPAVYAEKVQPPYDFMANFERIYDTAVAGSYASEYAFGFDLYRAFQMGHDGHFVYYPDSVTDVFFFGRTTPLVSVSADGKSIPEVFVYADILAASFGDIDFVPSPITEIDGQNSTEFLLNWSMYGSLQDQDALWNNMFYIPAQVSLGAAGTGTGTFSGGGRGRYVYPGPSTSLTFANGTTVVNQNFARVLQDFTGITSGEDVYQAFFVPPPGEPEDAEFLATMSVPPASATPTPPATSTSTTIPHPGYPSAFIREANNLNSGYFLEGEGYDDVAVLSVPSFVGSSGDELPFQAVNTYTINRAVAEGKKKLIIDVSANGGGTILQGYDLFKQLFPQLLPYGGTRFRAHEAFDFIGQEISHFAELVPRSLSDNDTTQNLLSTSWDFHTDADVNYQPFTSWAEKYGPHAFGPGPDNYTSIIRWNLSDVLTPDNSGGIDVSGYLNRSNITTQPFAAENIVIVYDGYCASTCTIFSELMRQQGGVKTIALGGRPNTDLIQAVGGVKGTNDYPWDFILSFVEVPFVYQYIHDDAFYNASALGQYSDLPLFRATNYVVNARDGLRQGDPTETPLQFQYEPADCRIFYTPAMVVDETAVWKSVADTAFNGVSHCVAGDYAAPSASAVASAAKRAPRALPHPVTPGLDLDGHRDAIADVWTGKGGVTLGGDAFMVV